MNFAENYLRNEYGKERRRYERTQAKKLQVEYPVNTLLQPKTYGMAAAALKGIEIMESADTYNIKLVDCPYCGCANELDDDMEYDQQEHNCDDCTRTFIIVD